MPDDKFQRGVAFFNSGEFFQAHEAWEELWLGETEPEKSFLQGLIQAAAAFHHYTRDQSGGAESLLASAAVKLRRYPREHRGIDVGSLRDQIVSWARALSGGERPSREELPRIGAARSST